MTEETTTVEATAPTEAEMLATIAKHGEPEAAPAPVVEAKPEGEEEPAAEAEPDPEPKPVKVKQTAQERIVELNTQLRETERAKDRDIEYWKAKALQAQPAETKTPATADTPAEDAPPNPDEYVYGAADEQYIADLVDFRVVQGLKAHSAKVAQQTAAEQAATTYAQREAAAKAKLTDYDEVVVEGGKRGDWICSDQMADAIRDSEDGPAVAYHLAKNPDEAARIAALSPVAQIREIGKLEAKLATPAAAPAPAAKTITTAPEPAPALRGQGGQFKVAADTSDFGAFDKAY